jgi:ubiquinone/menaquinone biosynthesis C-methylase UbiE
MKQYYPEVEAVVGDALDLPWPDKYFDAVYSNAVIEHVGDFEAQKKMAAEIMRVGKRWFVTSPNRWYPFEFHMRLPFVTWLPGKSYLWAARIVSYNHAYKRYMFGKRHYDDLRLLTARQLKCCFPDSKIIKQRVTFMAETLIAIGGEI